MHLVKHNEVLPPGICFLCEGVPTDRDQVVDLERDFLDAEDRLTGRKYACERCVAEAAHLLGFVHKDSFKVELEALQAEVEAVRAFQEMVGQAPKIHVPTMSASIKTRSR